MTERDPLIQVQSNGPQPPMYQMFTQAMLLTRALLPISRSADVWACPLRSCPSSVIGADHILPAQQPALAHWIMAVTAISSPLMSRYRYAPSTLPLLLTASAYNLIHWISRRMAVKRQCSFLSGNLWPGPPRILCQLSPTWPPELPIRATQAVVES